MRAAQKWLQVAERIADRIRSGAVPIGARLPSAADLAQQEGVAERTARKAVAHLAALKVVDVVPSVGAYAAQVPPVPLPKAPRPVTRLAAVEARLAAVEAEGAQLRERVERLEQRGGQPPYRG
jgi:DNA-binding GntR family transcriptional regulator